MRSLALFNNKGGVGKTTLTFNIAHMMARTGRRTVVLDYDPQCNISAIFLDEDAIEEIWGEDDSASHVAGCIELVRRGKGDVREPNLHEVDDNLWLLPGHLNLSRFEQTLAQEWSRTMATDNERALDVTTALDVLSDLAATSVEADLVLFDVGPSLGALNRAALLACDAVVLPLAPDLFSLQGLKNVGPTLRDWRQDWKMVRRSRMAGRPQADLEPHEFQPIGYLVQQHLARVDRPIRAYSKWVEQIPQTYHRFVVDQEPPAVSDDRPDPARIALIRHFASLVPYAQIARKPLFDLKQADGIGGGQIQAVAKCRREFQALTDEIASRLKMPPD
ncbi:MAG: AAA family ATPase [Polyangiaceae bacterium]|nr:AAA family ATPase [Polyangiaceae bacterium]